MIKLIGKIKAAAAKAWSWAKKNWKILAGVAAVILGIGAGAAAAGGVVTAIRKARTGKVVTPNDWQPVAGSPRLVSVKTKAGSWETIELPDGVVVRDVRRVSVDEGGPVTVEVRNAVIERR